MYKEYENMDNEQKCELLIADYMVIMKYPLDINDKVHEVAANRMGLTMDECRECQHIAEQRYWLANMKKEEEGGREIWGDK